MMNTLLSAALLSFASIAVAAPVAPAAAPSVARSTAVLSAELNLAPFCEGDASGVDKGLADARLSRDFWIMGGDEGAHTLMRYGVCRSLQGGADACATLKGLGGNFAAVCGEMTAKDRFIHQMFRSGDGVGACKKMWDSMGKRGPAVDRGCAALAAGVKAGDAAPSCPEVSRAGMFGPNESCEERFIFWKGVPAACASIKNLGQRVECNDDAALVAGLRDPSRCAASPACLALESKKPAVCDKYREEFFRPMCARVAKGAAVEKKRLARGEEERARQMERSRQQEVKAIYDAKLKAEAMARMKSEAPGAGKRQFQKNAPMADTNELLLENMERTTKGLPHLTEKEFKRLKQKPPTRAEPKPQPK